MRLFIVKTVGKSAFLIVLKKKLLYNWPERKKIVRKFFQVYAKKARKARPGPGRAQAWPGLEKVGPFPPLLFTLPDEHYPPYFGKHYPDTPRRDAPARLAPV